MNYQNLKTVTIDDDDFRVTTGTESDLVCKSAFIRLTRMGEVAEIHMSSFEARIIAANLIDAADALDFLEGGDNEK